MRSFFARILDFFNDVDRQLNGLTRTLKRLDRAESHQNKKADKAQAVAYAAVKEHEARVAAARKAAAVRSNINSIVNPEV